MCTHKHHNLRRHFLIKPHLTPRHKQDLDLSVHLQHSDQTTGKSKGLINHGTMVQKGDAVWNGREAVGSHKVSPSSLQLYLPKGILLKG